MNRSFVLIYAEKYECKSEAIRRESFLKSGRGRKWLSQNVPAYGDD